jgi:uncharacterized protein YndB with AHSA1/START domain
MSGNDDERELHLQRQVPFTRELVWKAMTEPEHVNAWWGPDGFHNEAVSMEFRVGGAWTFTMVGPRGTSRSSRPISRAQLPDDAARACSASVG